MTGFDLRGAQAVITGASSGIGRDLAAGLAAAGCDVLLAARREDRLRALAGELREARGVRADAFAVDLTAPGGTEALADRAAALGRPVDVLVQSAGLGRRGPFVDCSPDDEVRMVELNVAALTRLTRAFLPGMVERGRGAVLLVGSTAAYQAIPGYSVYAATKAYVLSLGEALGCELRGTGVTCTVLSPGTTATEFFDAPGQRLTAMQRRLCMPSAPVAAAGVRALQRGRPNVIPGLANRLGVALTRLVPRRLAASIAGRILRVGR